ncbi:hypothetical protein I7V27_20995 [Lelliottia amnigena]|uniref:Uncharacterized protein n=1 Tax=Lelliottia amnigena TaxID=61646 RepID=A0AAP2AID1_LELAM|nr:hypothetical protein [Lelliottia amnigena]MBL5936909.1 hypothetical protein [Lelliottia amnigena]NTZ41299.1 hypothetical protein [Enterobacter sp. JMULE2]
MTGYHRSSSAQTAIYPVKRLFGGHLTLRDYDAPRIEQYDARGYAKKCARCLRYMHIQGVLLAKSDLFNETAKNYKTMLHFACDIIVWNTVLLI